ncbi:MULTISPECIES: hypothetical protein [Amycolatopsis]|uniref:Minor tail protein n=1 Tax=Amycolatopsis tucumanensis TaxID=401106 RepID=A0ABP7JRY3_9PSEU|nr:hypothetical protein [Amycolatopsis tucumanensis]MCF6425071.1 hypothetical protein [Amycolatopsis tucumanensis]
MVEINPYAQPQQNTPRPSTIVDVIAETKRIVDAAARSNPLRNAIIDDGVVRWRGNYTDATTGDRSYYVRIGELDDVEQDPVLGKPQRGFSIRRDDPSGSIAFQVADWDANWRPGGPLRQRVRMYDRNGKPIFEEGLNGGLAWPWTSVCLYSMSDTTRPYTIATTTTAWQLVAFAEVYAHGPIVEAMGQILMGLNYSMDLRLSVGAFLTPGGSETIQTGTIASGTGAGSWYLSLDTAQSALWANNLGRYRIYVEARLTNANGNPTGPDLNAFLRPNWSGIAA